MTAPGLTVRSRKCGQLLKTSKPGHHPGQLFSLEFTHFTCVRIRKQNSVLVLGLIVLDEQCQWKFNIIYRTVTTIAKIPPIFQTQVSYRPKELKCEECVQNKANFSS